MNARQKAKRYKQLYEELLHKHNKVDTLRINKSYPRCFVVYESEEKVTKTVLEDLVYELTSQMDKYMTIKTAFEPYIDQYKFMAEVKVVRRGE